MLKKYIENPGNWTLADKIGLPPEVFFRNVKRGLEKLFFSRNSVCLIATKEQWTNSIDILYS